MFLCLPENQIPYPHQKVFFPNGGGYWGCVVKDCAAPMFIATVQPEGEPASERVTAMFADGSAPQASKYTGALSRRCASLRYLLQTAD
jgi:hypothetical protein